MTHKVFPNRIYRKIEGVTWDKLNRNLAPGESLWAMYHCDQGEVLMEVSSTKEYNKIMEISKSNAGTKLTMYAGPCKLPQGAHIE